MANTATKKASRRAKVAHAKRVHSRIKTDVEAKRVPDTDDTAELDALLALMADEDDGPEIDGDDESDVEGLFS